MSWLEEQEEVNGSDDLKSAIKKLSVIYKFDPLKVTGLLYVGGRVKQAPIPYAAKHQIILPHKHHIDLIVH